MLKINVMQRKLLYSIIGLLTFVSYGCDRNRESSEITKTHSMTLVSDMKYSLISNESGDVISEFNSLKHHSFDIEGNRYFIQRVSNDSEHPFFRRVFPRVDIEAATLGSIAHFFKFEPRPSDPGTEFHPIFTAIVVDDALKEAVLPDITVDNIKASVFLDMVCKSIGANYAVVGEVLYIYKD